MAAMCSSIGSAMDWSLSWLRTRLPGRRLAPKSGFPDDGVQKGRPSSYIAGVLRARQKDTESHERKSAADQPRPALGRRPWFALLRRARSLRRFAFAIRPESVARIGPTLTVVDPISGWSAAPVGLAVSARERWRGIRSNPGMVLIRTSRVHARGLNRPLLVIGLDGDGVVVDVSSLASGRFLHLQGAAWALEVPIDHERPARGARLAIYARRCGWKPDSLCDPDRQSR